MSRATSTPTTAMPPPAATAMPAIPHERIAKRAYEKWLKSGCKHGCDKQNWLEAEAELRSEMGRSAMPATAAKR